MADGTANLFADHALLAGGWARGVRLEIAGGAIRAIREGATAQPDDERCAWLLPGMPNVHSHAFQRGMAGLAEHRGPATDNFWSWRETMYRFALGMTADEMQAVAAQLYVEMLEAGFTRVGEFHYLHHDRDGALYADIGELAGQIVEAARKTGIGLTLLPVFYAHASFGGVDPTPGQRRFINDIDGFARLLERSREIAAQLPGSVVGVAPHSLRAAAPDEIATVSAMAPDGPIHIHAAEQTKEVDDCLAWSGARPVDWLLDNAGIDGRWCLIHATHMTDAETDRLARSGAVVGLCPVTEANLGDGVFQGPRFRAAGGFYGIGSDSNILIGVADELRQLEYAQRLHHRQRNVMAGGPGSTGRSLYAAALAGGSRALGHSAGRIAPGAPADLVSLQPRFRDGTDGDGLLDAHVFAAGAAVDGVWVAGRKLVSAGRHHAREPVALGFRKALAALMER